MSYEKGMGRGIPQELGHESLLKATGFWKMNVCDHFCAFPNF